MSAAELSAAVEALYLELVRQRGRDPSPLTPTQRLALVTAVDEGPLRLGALAAEMQTSDATATRTVDALEAHGFAERVPDEHDLRCVLIAATPAGRKHIDSRRRRLVGSLERSLAGMPEEDRERLLGLLRQLADLLGRDVAVR